MADLHELLSEIEAVETVRGSVEKFVDGVTALVATSNPTLGAKLTALRSALAMAITTNTSHIAVDGNSPARVKALALAVNRPNLVNAERVGQLEADVTTLTDEREAAAMLLTGISKERDELREALRAVQDELYAAQTQVVAMQRAFDEQTARSAAILATTQEQAAHGLIVLEAAKEAGAAAIRAAAAAEAVVKTREATETVEPAKE